MTAPELTTETAFGALTERHRRELQVHCYRILGSVQDAEDLLQETLLAAWRGLDVSVAHYLLVRQLWGLEDTVEIVGFRHDLDSALQAAGDTGTALLLNPTPVEAVAAVAAAGDRMPRKSTLFTPKPRTGLLLRLLDDQDAS